VSEPAREKRDWGDRARRLRNQTGVVVAVVVTVIVVYFAGRAFLPRWWSHRIGDQVNGSISAGIALGLFYGFVFTFLPLLVAWIGFRRGRPWRWWVAVAAVVVILATPNLMTLGIVFGSGGAAHAGQRTLDVEAPAYRWSALVGALIAVGAMALLFYLLFSRRVAHGRVKKLRERLNVGEAAPPPGDTPPG
jgi:MFS family permease